MANAAIIVLASPETADGLGRAANALEAAKWFAETDGDSVEMIFGSAGTQWVPLLEDEDHDYRDLYAAVRDAVSVCDYRVDAYGVGDEVDSAGVTRLGEHDGHPSIRLLVDDDYQIITF